MKSFKYVLFTFFAGCSFLAASQVAPGNSCDASGCSTAGSYSSLTGTASMGTYGCLFSTPNPNWLAIGISTAGDLHLQLTQTSTSGNPIDVDFALYGPYSSVDAGCPIDGNTPQVDCSFSASATEYVDIVGAQPGQVYILLVTNFNGSAGTISLGQSPNQSSSAGVNCDINFSASTTMTPAKCNQPNGSVTATGTGGYPPLSYSWNIPGNPTTPTVNNVPPGTYTVTVTSSPNPTTGQVPNPVTSTVTVTNQNAVFSATSIAASCAGGANGSATANFTMQGGSAGITATYQWNDPASQTSKTATGLLPGTYTCTITLSNGCVGTANVTVGANAVTYAATSTVVSCPGGTNGTASVTMTPVIGTPSYAWNDPAAQTTATATNLPAGTYTVTVTSSVGCTGTATVTITEIPGMVATVNQTLTKDPTCNSGSDGIVALNVTGGTPGYTYSWDHSTSTASSANDLPVGTHTATITDANGCVITRSATLTEPAPLNITLLSPDNFICPESSATLMVAGSGGSSPYTFTWTENGTVIGTGETILVDPSANSTSYCVTMTEACGSPSTDSCMTLTFPTEIVPVFNTDKESDCEPSEFKFFNESNNEYEIQSVFLEFGDGNDVTLVGNQDTSHVYQNAGIYDVKATVTSTYGCVTTAEFPGKVKVIKIPTADFGFSSNPTTMFETTVTAQDQSSPGVVSWEWESLESDPTASSVQNPTFAFPEGYTGTYEVRLIVSTQEGCVDTVVKTLTVNSDILFFAPNAFTPDGDEYNQTWKFYVDGIDRYNFELAIYNRWGQIMWETKDPDAGWDGTYNGQIAPAGAYTWKAKVKTVETDNKEEFYGEIVIIR